ncbi:DNA topoisomerase I [Pedobacter antarcticus 4BY]|uniref:DNA topoisomerase n=2 Tax=Pedobacter antarcticus TaxID=34086 RepID=A0A081PEI7_9SPHI|nr:DNA topoisomerase IB [Pedobacter antarcticus]KEQ29110.1 DNA topoisomerase I [Pedobacter antarcticus 4BY]SFE94300.1 DNA topoisomerase-1 [Pedobacter antarcticus]
MVDTTEEIKEIGLLYMTDTMPGIYRKGKPGKFHYENQNGSRVTDEKQVARINALVLPPAWTEVWIAPKKNAYLQATGLDALGRKQYRYHNDWTSRRSDRKYFRLLDFGKALPAARKKVAAHLRRKNYDEQKVLAICVEVMQHTLIRIGNNSYAQLYGSYGLSTLKDKHARLEGNQLKLKFVGKKGVKQEVTLRNKGLAKMVLRCKEIPGQDLFQYYTEGKEHRAVDSGKINNYIREITGGDFTAKDFRTWGGTLEAMRQLAVCNARQDEKSSHKKIIVEVLDCVASKLGNTRAVCKSSYVYPLLLESFEDGSLLPYLKKINRAAEGPVSQAMEHDEKVLMQFLRAAQKKSK